MKNSRDVDTTRTIVMPEPRWSWRALMAWVRENYRWLWLPVVAEISLSLFAASSVTVPYYALAPGSATQVSQFMQVPKDLDYPAKGQLLLTTVSLQHVTAFGALAGWLDPEVDVVPEKDILGPTPPKNFRQQNIQEMDDSILIAEVVALRKLGYPVTEHGNGALVTAVAPKTPAEGHLKPGDVITQLNRTPIHLATDLVGVLTTMKFGDTVQLAVTTNGQPSRTETIKLGGTNAEKTACSIDNALSGKGCVGISLGTKDHTFDQPVKIGIDAGGIGGPSAGLAFTLAIIDALRPGELTGGHKVAVTGTIDFNGTVGDVGGVVQKTAAVKAAGAEVFLVPPGEYKEAKAHAGKHLKVVKVATLDEALQELGHLGGDIAALATTTTTPPRRH